jgi:hypothetical protein
VIISEDEFVFAGDQDRKARGIKRNWGGKVRPFSVGWISSPWWSRYEVNVGWFKQKVTPTWVAERVEKLGGVALGGRKPRQVRRIRVKQQQALGNGCCIYNCEAVR